MASQLHIFFAAAREKAAQDRAAVLAREEAEKRRKIAQRVNMDTLKAELRTEFGGFFQALENLPPKDGKSFTVKTREELPQDSTDAACYFSAFYGGTSEQASGYSPGDHAEPRSGFNLSIRRHGERGMLDIAVTQYWLTERSRYGSGTHYKTDKVADFAAVWKILGTGLGTFAPERIEDLSRSMGFVEGQSPTPARPAFRL